MLVSYTHIVGDPHTYINYDHADPLQFQGVTYDSGVRLCS